MKNNFNSDIYKIIIKKLNNDNLDNIELIGIICFIIYSKEIFPKNKDISEFLKDIFGEVYPEYLMKSRPLIVARLSNKLKTMEKETVLNIHKKLIKYFGIKSDNFLKVNKKKNANDKMETWLKGL